MDGLVHLALHAREPFDVINRAVEQVLDKTHVVLEDAWKNVSRGEPRFRWSFRIAFTTLIWWLSRHGGSLRALIGQR
jgi:hypothetical protein